jgi:tripartite motif-containing protein 71
MIKAKTTMWAVLLLVGILAACSGNTSTPQPPAATSTAAITSATVAPIVVWSGDHPTVQMDLIETITGGSKPFGQVRGVALDKDGNLYAVDGVSSQVLKFDPTGKFLMQWGSKGTGDGQFVMSGLQGEDTTGFVALDSQGNIYVTENNRVQKFDSNGKFLTKWGAPGTGDGQFGLALAIAIDAQDDVYVVDINNSVVQKFDSNGKFLLKWGGKGSGEGQFNLLDAVAIDRQGDVLVTDSATGRLQKFDRNGRFLNMVYLGAVDGLVIGPVALAVGNQGQIYIGEYAHGRVVEFDSSGKLLAAWGNTGTYQEQMSEAGGLAIDKDGTVYVADAFNHRVLKFRQH